MQGRSRCQAQQVVLGSLPCGRGCLGNLPGAGPGLWLVLMSPRWDSGRGKTPGIGGGRGMVRVGGECDTDHKGFCVHLLQYITNEVHFCTAAAVSELVLAACARVVRKLACMVTSLHVNQNT